MYVHTVSTILLAHATACIATSSTVPPTTATDATTDGTTQANTANKDEDNRVGLWIAVSVSCVALAVIILCIMGKVKCNKRKRMKARKKSKNGNRDEGIIFSSIISQSKQNGIAENDKSKKKEDMFFENQKRKRSSSDTSIVAPIFLNEADVQRHNKERNDKAVKHTGHVDNNEMDNYMATLPLTGLDKRSDSMRNIYVVTKVNNLEKINHDRVHNRITEEENISETLHKDRNTSADGHVSITNNRNIGGHIFNPIGKKQTQIMGIATASAESKNCWEAEYRRTSFYSSTSTCSSADTELPHHLNSSNLSEDHAFRTPRPTTPGPTLHSKYTDTTNVKTDRQNEIAYSNTAINPTKQINGVMSGNLNTFSGFGQLSIMQSANATENAGKIVSQSSLPSTRVVNDYSFEEFPLETSSPRETAEIFEPGEDNLKAKIQNSIGNREDKDDCIIKTSANQDFVVTNSSQYNEATFANIANECTVINVVEHPDYTMHRVSSSDKAAIRNSKRSGVKSEKNKGQYENSNDNNKYNHTNSKASKYKGCTDTQYSGGNARFLQRILDNSRDYQDDDDVIDGGNSDTLPPQKTGDVSSDDRKYGITTTVTVTKTRSTVKNPKSNKRKPKRPKSALSRLVSERIATTSSSNPKLECNQYGNVITQRETAQMHKPHFAIDPQVTNNKGIHEINNGLTAHSDVNFKGPFVIQVSHITIPQSTNGECTDIDATNPSDILGSRIRKKNKTEKNNPPTRDRVDNVKANGDRSSPCSIPITSETVYDSSNVHPSESNVLEHKLVAQADIHGAQHQTTTNAKPKSMKVSPITHVKTDKSIKTPQITKNGDNVTTSTRNVRYYLCPTPVDHQSTVYDENPETILCSPVKPNAVDHSYAFAAHAEKDVKVLKDAIVKQSDVGEHTRLERFGQRSIDQATSSSFSPKPLLTVRPFRQKLSNEEKYFNDTSSDTSISSAPEQMEPPDKPNFTDINSQTRERSQSVMSSVGIMNVKSVKRKRKQISRHTKSTTERAIEAVESDKAAKKAATIKSIVQKYKQGHNSFTQQHRFENNITKFSREMTNTPDMCKMMNAINTEVDTNANTAPAVTSERHERIRRGSDDRTERRTAARVAFRRVSRRPTLTVIQSTLDKTRRDGSKSRGTPTTEYTRHLSLRKRSESVPLGRRSFLSPKPEGP